MTPIPPPKTMVRAKPARACQLRLFKGSVPHRSMGLKHKERKNGTDRINHNPLPARNRTDPPDRSDMPQERSNDGRPGNDQDRPQQQRLEQAEAQNAAGDPCGKSPGDQNPDRQQVEQGAADLALTKFTNIETEAPLEQNHRDRQGNDGEQQVAKKCVRLDQSSQRPGYQPAAEQ